MHKRMPPDKFGYWSSGNMTDDQIYTVIDCPHISHDAFIMVNFGSEALGEA